MWPITQVSALVLCLQVLENTYLLRYSYQLIAYYDAARQMSVAVREIGDVNGGPWIYHKLPSFLGWDAHNSVEAAFVDGNGNIVVPASWRGVYWQWQVDHKTLKVLSGGPVKKSLPFAIKKYDEDNGIPLRVMPLMENQKHPSQKVFISWEAMQPNRDQARADISLPFCSNVSKWLAFLCWLFFSLFLCKILAFSIYRYFDIIECLFV